MAGLAVASYYQSNYAKAVEYFELCLPMVRQFGEPKTEKVFVVMLHAAKKALGASRNFMSVYY